MIKEILTELKDLDEGLFDGTGISIGPRLSTKKGSIVKMILKTLMCSKAKKWVKQAGEVAEPKYGLFKMEGKLQGKQKLKGLWSARLDNIEGSMVTIYAEEENGPGMVIDLCVNDNTSFYTPVPYSTKRERMPNRLLKAIK